MLIVAAIGIGLAWFRSFYGIYIGTMFLNPPGGFRDLLRPRVMPALIIPTLPSFALVTIALSLLRLVPPRPGFVRLATSPGSVALLAASIILLVSLAGGCISVWDAIDFDDPREDHLASGLNHPFWTGLEGAVPSVASATLVAWAVLAVGRRFHPEKSWVEVAGLALGVAWIVSALCVWWFESILHGENMFLHEYGGKM
jgi:hypothetical protein